jgi:hypothetical protein
MAIESGNHYREGETPQGIVGPQGKSLSELSPSQGIGAINSRTTALPKDDRSIHVPLPESAILGSTESDASGYDITSLRHGECDFLIAKKDDATFGELTYVEEEGVYTVDSIASVVPNKGAAKALLSKFTSVIGEHVPVRAYITHTPTQEALLDEPTREAASVQGTVHIEDRGQLDNLPFSKIFLSGGIVADRVEVHYNPTNPENPYEIEYFGTTNTSRASEIREQSHSKE